MNKENVLNPHHQVSLKKNKIMSLAGKWIELENIMLSKIM
jgi:hypothetical protein